jgi:hypothetical protein
MRSREFLLLFLFAFIGHSNSFSYGVKEGDTTVIADKRYKAKWLKQLFLGTHYRKEYATPITVPVFDIDTIQGGLEPIKLGGSRQTTNLRLKDNLGREYVIRSVNKTPSRALPKALQPTVVGKIVQDQASAEHPYAACVIPTLSNAASIYHTNPKLYYVPYDTSFGEFTETFAGTLVFFEERPNENMVHSDNTGNAINVIGTEKLFENLYKDPDNKVDDRFFIKTRLFDMWIGDWGRHEDQWRWAEYKQDEGSIYRPIPRDRDHAFFKFDGIFPFMGSRKAGLRQFTNFNRKINNVYGLNKSATSLDRAILNNLTKEDWVSTAEELKKPLTDEVIDNAIKKLPTEIYKLHGKEIADKLKSRRDYLDDAAKNYYKEISKKIDIIGSDKNETFIVRRLPSDKTDVLIVKSKNLQDTIYHRVIDGKETKEIRLYGLGGTDEFHFDGRVRKGMKIRVIGGEGEDTYTDSASVKGLLDRLYIYDTKTGNTIKKNKDTRVVTSDRSIDSITIYKRNAPDYNYTSIIPTAEYNPDDGIFLGLGALRKTFGFRRAPYASFQTIRLNYATQTSSVSFRYNADFKKIFGKLNLKIDTRYFGPRFAYNYFGFGNNSVQKDTAIDYYRVRAYRYIIEPFIYKNLTKAIEVGVGPHYEYVNIIKTPGRFISEPGSVPNPNDYDPNNYVGINSYIKISSYGNLFDQSQNIITPKQGIKWIAEAGVYDKLENSKPYANLHSNISLFYTPPLPIRITLATRLGAATNFGDFAFYRGNTLGGTTNLRGYRRGRFFGRSSVYHNTEARIYLGTVNFLLFPGKVGLIAFYDYGRVWADGEKSNRIHSGYGPGIFIQILNRTTFSGTYGFSEDKGFFNFQIGFLF